MSFLWGALGGVFVAFAQLLLSLKTLVKARHPKVLRTLGAAGLNAMVLGTMGGILGLVLSGRAGDFVTGASATGFASLFLVGGPDDANANV